jgi:uncharacterized protein YvpB
MTASSPPPAQPTIAQPPLAKPPPVPLPPTYAGVKEVLLGKPVTLKGSYDAARIAKLTIRVEDRVNLNVSFSQGTWKIDMPKGFSVAGSRWLRIRGFDKAGKEVDNQVFYLTVSTDPLTVGQDLELKVIQDTFFKVSPQDSSKLNAQQKVLVRAGQTFKVTRYGLIDAHLKLELGSAIGNIGSFGYFYEGAVQLAKGGKVLRFSLDDVADTVTDGLQMLVTTTTFFKASRADSSILPESQKFQLLQGQTLALKGYACLGGHFRVTLREPLPGVGDRGMLYWRHVRLVRNGVEIPFDPDALTATILQTTPLKKQPLESNKLPLQDKVTLNAGRVYGISSYGVEGGHIKLATTEEFDRFGNTGYIFPAYLRLLRGGRSLNPIPPQVELNVPYFSQRDNPRLYWATCNVTAIAMVFYYYGVRSRRGEQLEDELLQWCFDNRGYGSQTDHNCLVALIQAYGFQAQFSTKYTWQEIREELINRRPVILCGYFTHGGHIITLIGYTPYGFIVNDPWGDGYYGYASTEGRKLLYPFDYCTAMAGSDGEVWAHFIRKTPKS